MLDRLPLELLDHVHVLDLLPPPLHLHELDERRSALHACCLFDKRVGARATNLLYRDVLLDRVSQLLELSSTLRERTAEGPEVRSLWIEPDSDWQDLAEVAAVFSFLPSLRRLRWCWAGGSVELQDTSAYLPKLETLFLDYQTLFALPSTFILPSLVSLSLHETLLDINSASTIAETTTLPSLKAFAYTANGDNYNNGHVVAHLVEALSGRLDIFQLHLEDRLDDLIPLSPGLDNLCPSSLRLFLTSALDVDDAETLSTQLSGPRPWLRRVYLPILLRPSSLGAEHNELLLLLNCLVDRLEDAKVDVHWYDSKVEEEYGVSPSFWRDAKTPSSCCSAEV